MLRNTLMSRKTAALPSLVVLAAVVLVPTDSLAQSVHDESAAAENPEATAEIYQAKCARCHGEDGQGVTDGYGEPFRLDQSVDELTELIVETMPEEDPESCVGEEARKLAVYLAGRFAADQPVAADPRISRMTVNQYRNAVADLVGRFAPVREQDHGPEVPGLRGEYYQSEGMNKADRLAHYRSDSRLEFDFGESGPVPSISPDQFAVIWQGGLVAEHTGHYEFRVTTENGARLYLNLDPQPGRWRLRDDSSEAGQQALIDAWVGSGKQREKTARLFLLGGRTYPIRLEFFKYLEDRASVKLEWKPPHGTWSVLDYNHTTTRSAPRVYVCETAFPADDRSLGFERGVSVSPGWQAATMNAAIETAAEVVERLPALAELPAIDESDENGERVARARQFVLDFATTAYRRPLTKPERSTLSELIGDDSGQLETSVRRAVILTLMSPNFLYPDLTPAGETPTPHAIASRLSFGLWDSIPDSELTEAADKGKLGTAEQVHSQARRMLRNPRTKAKTREFFRGWLELEERDLSKDKQLFPNFDEAVVADLRRSLELFIDEVVWSRDSDYRQLLLADYLMLNDRLAERYGEQAEAEKELDGQEIKRRARRRVFASEFQPVDFPSERRSGVLTHPYLLSAYAYHNNSSPIHRGVFLTRNIVGRALAPPPIAVAFKDDEFDPDLTMREKVTLLTRDSACMSCHSVINPLGFTLESYDAVGRWRKTENRKPVDTQSEYVTADGKTLKLASARDVAEFAVNNESAHRAFVTHVFEHVVKRSPRDFSPELLDQLRARFERDEFNIQNLWARIAAVAAIEDLTEPSTLLAEKSK